MLNCNRGSDPRLDGSRSPRLPRLEKMRGRRRSRPACAARSRDNRIADFEHAFEIDRPAREGRLLDEPIGRCRRRRARNSLGGVSV